KTSKEEIRSATAIKITLVEETAYLFTPTIIIEMTIIEKTMTKSKTSAIIKVEMPISTGNLNFLLRT
ncbi:unnamed protein product, partial [marine sediment metagenome]